MRSHRWLWFGLLAACASAPRRIEADELGRVAGDLRGYALRQIRELHLPGVWIAVLDVDPSTGHEALWAEGWSAGDAAERPAPAPCDAVHRVASISKLFTATALMRLVELGKVDLDLPVRTWLPDFAPQNPFGTEVTLRHLLGHTAGLVREPPVGHYFDPDEPTLVATVASLNDTALVFAPGTTFKYSNPGPAVVGQVIANVTGKPFEAAVRELVLDPLGLRDTDFVARGDLRRRQPHGAMWTYDGRDIPTPDFAWGFGPAANLRSTTVELVRFAQSWFPFSAQRVLWPETLTAMWQPPGQPHGCGLGFFVDALDGHRRVGHDGAGYGFASVLRALPEQGLAVAVVITLDFGNGAAAAIADRALRAALANRRGASLPPADDPAPLGVAAARALAGHYRCGEYRVDLRERGGELYYDPDVGVRTRLRRATDGALVADDPLAIGGARRLVQQPNGVLFDGEAEYLRDDAVPAAAPPELLPLLGEYGWDHDVLIVYEDHGRLGVLIEWVVRDLPDRVGSDRYVFPPGMYGGDVLQFERGPGGAAVAATIGGVRFERRPEPPWGGLAPAPVRGDDPETVLAELSPLTGEALLRARQSLARDGLGLVVRKTYGLGSAAMPGADPAHAAQHVRGGAVDVELTDPLTGETLAMPSACLEPTPRAHADWPGGTSRQRWYRSRLRLAMETAGFRAHERAWWHFDFVGGPGHPVGNEPR